MRAILIVLSSFIIACEGSSTSGDPGAGGTSSVTGTTTSAASNASTSGATTTTSGSAGGGSSSTSASGTGGSAASTSASGSATTGAGGGGGVLSQPSYDPVMVFANTFPIVQHVGIAWDGTSLWVAGYGNQAGLTEVQYSATGVYIEAFEPYFDFTTIYTKGDGIGPLHAREQATNNVAVMLSPEKWSEPLTLGGASLPALTKVVWDADHAEYIALVDGTLRRWNTTGNALPNVAFQGFGSQNDEGNYPQSRRVAWAYGYYLTYSTLASFGGTGVISAWDTSGARIATAELDGAGLTFDSLLSFSFAQGKAWVMDADQTKWRGFDISQ